MSNIQVAGSLLNQLMEEYERQQLLIEPAIDALRDALNKLDNTIALRGQYVDSVVPYVSIHASDCLSNLRESAWQALLVAFNFKAIMPANDYNKITQKIQGSRCPQFTRENVRDLLGDYIVRPKYYYLKRVSDLLSSLDSFYKSHSINKFGVGGKPKRIIINLNEDLGIMYRKSNYDRLEQVYEIILVEAYGYRMEQTKRLTGILSNRLLSNRSKDEYLCEVTGLKFRFFENGNVHMFMTQLHTDTLNLLVGQFYGDALPDYKADKNKPTNARKASSKVSKDLQFYATPSQLAHRVIAELDIQKEDYVLEPSCGDGALIKAILATSKPKEIVGIEYDTDRYNISAKLYNKNQVKISNRNFLEYDNLHGFDKIAMNPPFAHKHYQQHIEKALSMLNPNGTLVAILPETATTSHDYVRDLQEQGYNATWITLPAGSFKESNTNVDTGILKIIK